MTKTHMEDLTVDARLSCVTKVTPPEATCSRAPSKCNNIIISNLNMK